MNLTALKIVGVVASVAGVAATLVSNWVGEKQQDAKIAEKVSEAFAQLSDKES